MNKILLTLGLTSSVFVYALAQLPVQVFGSREALEYSFLWFKDLDKKGKITLFNFTYFTAHYKDHTKNAYEIYQVATYNLKKNWGLAMGGRFTNGQLVPQIAVSYQVEKKDFYFNLFPTLHYVGDRRVAYSLFGLLFYTPRINGRWRMFNQLAFEPLFNGKEMIYAYQQLRVGLDYKELFQFGLGANFEQIGKNPEARQNFGVFIRKELH